MDDNKIVITDNNGDQNVLDLTWHVLVSATLKSGKNSI